MAKCGIWLEVSFSACTEHFLAIVCSTIARVREQGGGVVHVFRFLCGPEVRIGGVVGTGCILGGRHRSGAESGSSSARRRIALFLTRGSRTVRLFAAKSRMFYRSPGLRALFLQVAWPGLRRCFSERAKKSRGAFPLCVHFSLVSSAGRGGSYPESLLVCVDGGIS